MKAVTLVIPVTPLSVTLLREWDDKLDTMETLFDACVELDEPCEEQLATVRKLRRQLRELCPLDCVPIIPNGEDVSR
jgi:hypothetical protein